MAKMKTEFPLKVKKPTGDFMASAKIVNYGGRRSYLIVDSHHVYPYKQGPHLELRGKSLETFAVNILKALNSKHLKSKK